VSRDVTGPAGPAGPVLVGVHGAAAADEALRYAFAEADHRGVPLTAVLTGTAPWPGSGDQSELVRLWAEKYPEVPVTITIRRGLDPAVVIAAASHGCGLLVVPRPTDAGTAAVVDAVSHRAHCPVVVVGEAAVPTGAAA
jgi:hypothetical protein